MPQHDPRIGEIYRHFKGNIYQITGIATHSETREKMVVYQALYGDFGTYVRPYDMFISEVDYEKYPEVTAQYRFTLVNPATLRQGSTRPVANPTPQPVSTPVAPSVTAAPKAAPTVETTARWRISAYDCVFGYG